MKQMVTMMTMTMITFSLLVLLLVSTLDVSAVTAATTLVYDSVEECSFQNHNDTVVTFTKRPDPDIEPPPRYGPGIFEEGTTAPTPVPPQLLQAIITASPTVPPPPPPECLKEYMMEPILVQTNADDDDEVPTTNGDNVVTVISRSPDGSTVEFQTSQEYGSDVTWFAVEYETLEYGPTCSDYNNVKQGQIPTTFEAKCNAKTGKAVVTIYASGSSNSGFPYPNDDDQLQQNCECYLPPESAILISKYEILCGDVCEPAPCVDQESMEPIQTETNYDDDNIDNIITIVERSDDGSTVGFEVSQEYSNDDEELEWFAVEYDNLDGTGTTTCAEFQGVNPGTVPDSKIKALCGTNWMATVTVYAYGGSSSSDLFSDLPPYTGSTECNLPSNGGGGVIATTFELPCAELCVTPLGLPETDAPTTDSPTETPTPPLAPPPCLDEDTMMPSLVNQNEEVPTTTTGRDDVIKIVERSEDGLQVGFEVSQQLSPDDVKYVMVEYEAEDGQPTCTEFSNVGPGSLPSPFTASCGRGDWTASVTVYVYDDEAFPDVPPYTEPSGCTLPTTGGVIASTYELPCSVLCEGVAEPTDAPTAGPTTASPTTDAPVTASPTTTAPVVTAKPTTAVPATDTPTAPPTATPTTTAPITAKPTTAAPTDTPTATPTASPSTASPSTQEPTTDAPTATPTATPTDTPTATPTSKPTVKETEEPTTAPTECIPKMEVEQVGNFGDFEPSEEILKILQQSTDGKTVTVQLNQAWKLTELDWIGAQYESVDNGMVCYGEDNVISGPINSIFTAKCVEGVAEFQVFVRDDCFLPMMGITEPQVGMEAPTPIMVQGFPDPDGDGLPSSPSSSSSSSGDDDSPPVVVDPLGVGVEVIEEPTVKTCPHPEHISTDGVTKFQKNPIEIISYGDEKVTFKVNQVWKSKDKVSWIATHYPTGPSTVNCPKVEEVSPDKPLVYSAYCTDGSADVSLFVHDGQFSVSGDTCTPPSYCKGNSKTKKVGYEFKLPCSCPAMHNRRRLVAGGGNSLSTGICEVQGGTLTATYRAPCSPGCGEDPILLALPSFTDKPTPAPTTKPTPKDECPEDPDKETPGICGCGQKDNDSDGDGTLDCLDECPEDKDKVTVGQCGCGVLETDSDGDGVADCNDLCPTDPEKTMPGACGCGQKDIDSDRDGTLDCLDECPEDKDKVTVGQCGCGVLETDSDGDGVADCNDLCPTDPDKTIPGACGCGILDLDEDDNGIFDCNEVVPLGEPCDIKCCDGTTVCDENECPSFTSSGKLEVCFVLDESGSVCSKEGRLSGCTTSYSSSQRNSCEFNGKHDKNDPDYCPKFNTNTKDFVRGFISSMDEFASGLGASTHYAVATFSSNADWDQDLSGTSKTVSTINSLSFEGGYTQTAHGMERCQALLQKGNPEADKLLVIVTDGRPRLDHTDPESYFATTKSYAENIKSGKKAAGGGSAPAMKIMAIGVQTVESDLSFVRDLASPGHSFELSSGYTELSNKIGSITSNAIESSCGDVVEPLGLSIKSQNSVKSQKSNKSDDSNKSEDDIEEGCPLVEMDFNDVGLVAGEYVTDKLKKHHGLTIKAYAKSGGFTPGNAARVFDTANPGTNNDDGDPDLGSPNQNCEGGGPGVGEGGGPDSDFPNCKPQGFVMIVQERKNRKYMKYPDDNRKGGSIKFAFDKPVNLETVYILDIDEHKRVAVDVVTAGGGKQPTLKSPKDYYADNGLFPLKVNKEGVKEFTVTFPGSGAVAQLDYRPQECVPTFGRTSEPYEPQSCILKRSSGLFKFEEWPEREDVYIQIKIVETGQIYNFTRDTTGFPGDHGVDNYMTVPEFYVEDPKTFQAFYNAQWGDGIAFQYVSEIGPGGWNSCKYSPIALDLDHSGKVERIEGDFAIDIIGDGGDEELNEWFAPTEGILVQDPDDVVDGEVTGTHLLGDMGRKYADGFDKLALLDSNGDGIVDANDDGFSKLHLWVDKNSNAHLDEGELFELSDYGVVGIYTSHDEDHVSKAKLEDGTEMVTQDLWFSR